MSSTSWAISTEMARWTSFISEPGGGKRVRGLHEEANPRHRLRVEHDERTLLIHLSGEEPGDVWTTIAVDRETRRVHVEQDPRQADSARKAHDGLYGQERWRPI